MYYLCYQFPTPFLRPDEEWNLLSFFANLITKITWTPRRFAGHKLFALLNNSEGFAKRGNNKTEEGLLRLLFYVYVWKKNPISYFSSLSFPEKWVRNLCCAKSKATSALVRTCNWKVKANLCQVNVKLTALVTSSPSNFLLLNPVRQIEKNYFVISLPHLHLWRIKKKWLFVYMIYDTYSRNSVGHFPQLHGDFRFSNFSWPVIVTTPF